MALRGTAVKTPSRPRRTSLVVAVVHWSMPRSVNKFLKVVTARRISQANSEADCQQQFLGHGGSFTKNNLNLS